MKLLILSDLHLEFDAALTVPEDADHDVVILAGDIHSPGSAAVRWAQSDDALAGKPVVYVPGNHEFYGALHFASEMQNMERAADGGAVQVLNRRSVVIGGVRILGCMLWTDFQLPLVTEGILDSHVEHALRAANLSMADFRQIHLMAPAIRDLRQRELKRFLRAEDTLAMHWIDRDWLRRELMKPFDGPTVVVTHHAPSKESVHPRYAGDALTPSFVSDLPDHFFDVPSLWIHGHTHSSADYSRGRCRVISNPRGYRLTDGTFENEAFDPGLVVDVSDGSNPWR